MGADPRKITLSEKQALAWHYLERDPKSREILFGGAAGPGKTWFGCVWKMIRRIEYPGTRGLIGRERYTDLRDSTLKKYLALWEEFGKYNPRGITGRFNQQDKTFYFSNGSEEVFRHMAYEPRDPEYNRFGSTEYTDLFVDEVQEISRRAWEIAISRLRYNLHLLNIPIAKALGCANPQEGWVKKKFVINDQGEEIDLPENLAYVPSLLSDNPDADFVRIYDENLSSLSNYDQARLRYGDWSAIRVDGQRFYHGFEIRRHIKPAAQYNPALPLHFSFDQNVAPYITCVISQVLRDGAGIYDLNMIDEICLSHPRNSTPALCKAILAKYGGHKSGGYIYGDASGRSRHHRSADPDETDYTIILREIREILSDRADRTARKNPSVLRRKDFINAIFVEDRRLANLARINISPNCHKLRADLLSVLEDKNGHKQKKRERDPESGEQVEIFGHTSDAMDYFITAILKPDFDRFVGRRS